MAGCVKCDAADRFCPVGEKIFDAAADGWLEDLFEHFIGVRPVRVDRAG